MPQKLNNQPPLSIKFGLSEKESHFGFLRLPRGERSVHPLASQSECAKSTIHRCDIQ